MTRCVQTLLIAADEATGVIVPFSASGVSPIEFLSHERLHLVSFTRGPSPIEPLNL